jgi:endo-1,4-beta-xylanase
MAVEAGAGSLREAASNGKLAVGAAVDARALRSEGEYRETLAREFGVCVGENAFKFERIHPQRGRYAWTAADEIEQFAEQHGMRLRGHTLVWHNQLPAWVKGGSFTRDEAIALMREHITTVMGRYKGKVWAWDVVNEAVADDGSGLRKTSFWYTSIGPDYVEMAFRFAREADPGAQLYYNDYDAEHAGPKADAVYALVRDLRERGVPIDGVGWQMHVRAGATITDGYRENARRLAALGLRLQITELDVQIALPVTAEKLAAQASTYREVVTFALAEPAFDAVVLWGFTDKHSWIPRFFKGYGAALPLDERYRPKPAYGAILDALRRPSAS